MYTVQEIATKDVTTRFGVKPSYRVKLSGEWFNFGFKKPGFAVGDNINFNFTEGKYGKEADAATVKVISSGEAGSVTPAAAPTRTFGPPTRPFPIPALHGDRAIVRQNALTNAREMVSGSGLFHRTASESDDEYNTRMAFEILRVAKIFESYTTGDADLAEAMKEE